MTLQNICQLLATNFLLFHAYCKSVKKYQKFVILSECQTSYQSPADVNNLQQYNRLFLRQKQFDFTLK